MRIEILLEDMSKLIEPVISTLTQKYGEPIGQGKNRIVFARGNVVIKVPKNESGVYANYQEKNKFDESMKDGDHSMRVYAKCRLVHVRDVPVLVMERIKPIKYSEVKAKDLPDWAWKVDALQVGHNKKGKMKAFDYAD
jgi:hypothetical protein